MNNNWTTTVRDNFFFFIIANNTFSEIVFCLFIFLLRNEEKNGQFYLKCIKFVA